MSKCASQRKNHSQQSGNMRRKDYHVPWHCEQTDKILLTWLLSCHEWLSSIHLPGANGGVGSYGLQVKWLHLKAFGIGNSWVTMNLIILCLFNFTSNSLCFFYPEQTAMTLLTHEFHNLRIILLFSSMSWVFYLHLCVFFLFKTAYSCPSPCNFVNYPSEARPYFLVFTYHKLVYNLF